MSDEESAPPDEASSSQSQLQSQLQSQASSSLAIADPPTEDPNPAITIGSSPGTPAHDGDTDDATIDTATTDRNENRSRASTRIVIVPYNPIALPSSQRQSLRSLSYWKIFRRLCLILTYPGMVVMTIIGLIMVLVFCVLPTLLFMGTCISVYYCFHSEPLPLSLLLRNVFAGDNYEHRRPFFHTFDPDADRHDPNSAPARADRALYRFKLIVRKLLRVETIPSSFLLPSHDGTAVIIDNRDNIPISDSGCDSKISDVNSACKKLTDGLRLRKNKFPIRIWTNHKSLYFSAPLEISTKDSDSEDDSDKTPRLAKENREVAGGDIENGNDNANTLDFVPHLWRSSENELPIRNLRTTIAPANIDPHLEHGQNSSVLNAATSISLGDAIESSADSCSSGNDVSAHRNALPPLRNASDAGSIADVTENEGGGGHIDSNSDSGNGNGGIGGERTKNRVISNSEADYLYGTEDDARDPGMTCDICILEFEVGDEVAWSPNLNCSHTFHKDCILDWLLRNPTCPSCRQNYVNGNADDSV